MYLAIFLIISMGANLINWFLMTWGGCQLASSISIWQTSCALAGIIGGSPMSQCKDVVMSSNWKLVCGL